MAHERIEINLPLAKVYELLSTPVEFPKFMTSLKEVNKLSSQSFEYVAEFGGEEYRWTTNVIDDLRNTRFAWITINGNLNQTGTIRFTPLDNGKRTRVDFSLDYRTFFGEPSKALGDFISGLSATLQAELEKFRELAESDGFLEGSAAANKEVTA
jgi:uncharacterized membrane protein